MSRRDPLSMPRRAFTVAEANELLPGLEAVLARVEAMRVALHEHHEKLQVLEVLWGERLHDPDSPDHREAVDHRTAVLDGMQDIEELIAREIVRRGIRFPQGGLEHGLLDFPTTWDGRWVYLCWRRGEPSLAAWHEVDGGYAGRRPITPEHERRMGREDAPGTIDDSALDL